MILLHTFGQRGFQLLINFYFQAKLNTNRYATKKTIAQGMLDIALLSTNASQLKYVLQVRLFFSQQKSSDKPHNSVKAASVLPNYTTNCSYTKSYCKSATIY